MTSVKGRRVRRILITKQEKSKVAELTSGRTTNGFGDINHVDNDSLDAIAFALYFGKELGHLVTIEGVRNVSVYVVTHLVAENDECL